MLCHNVVYNVIMIRTAVCNKTGEDIKPGDVIWHDDWPYGLIEYVEHWSTKLERFIIYGRCYNLILHNKEDRHLYHVEKYKSKNWPRAMQVGTMNTLMWKGNWHKMVGTDYEIPR